METPLPSYPVECNEKFLVYLPKSLHRGLLDQAEREGVSLNQYVVSVPETMDNSLNTASCDSDRHAILTVHRRA